MQSSHIIIYIYFIFCLQGCASPGEGPSGGKCDIDPPKFLHSNPPQKSIHVNQSKITIFFDKYIFLQNPIEKVIVSPPQNHSPSIKVDEKKITVKLNDPLIANTTYTIDFKDGIIDNNEGNILKDFSFAFSTGNVIDSLCISGILLNSENLEPMSDIMIGIHSNLNDTAFMCLPFLKITLTDKTGHFQIKNVAEGIYHIFALDDINRNFKFNSPLEALAFTDSVIILSSYSNVITDTNWKDRLTVNTTKTIQKAHFDSNNIILYLFKEDFQPQYLFETERNSTSQWIMNFYSKIRIFPKVSLLDEKLSNLKDWYIRELSPDKKKIIYWITNPLIYSKDTLQIKVTYQATNSKQKIVFVTDTINLTQEKNLKQKLNKNLTTIKILNEKIMDIFDTIKVVFSEPIYSFKKNWIQLKQLKDTSWEACSFFVIQDSLNPRSYYISNQWEFSKEYKISIDSNVILSIYNNGNHAVQSQFKIKSKDNYGDLFVKIIGTNSKGFGQILDENENVVKNTILTNNQLIFQNVKPGRYFLRYVEDINNNGKWDTGSYSERKQPEKVFYYPNALEIKQLVELTKTWDLKKVPVDKQKPQEITKNKPIHSFETQK